MLRKIFLGIVFVMITSLLGPTILGDGSTQTVYLEWAARYNGPNVHGSDIANKVAMDSYGNVYVTGQSPSIGQGNDYVTVKYNLAGAQVWVARYNRGTGNDFALDIAVDSAGNVYVTGDSEGDFATIKYNSSGTETWIRTYDSGGNDYASAMAVDSAGNVYVTGRSNDDFVTIKYDSGGTEIWVRTHDSGGIDYANNIAVDSAGSIYVTGSSNDDFVTINYDSAGTEQWIASYDGPGNGVDIAFGLTVKYGYVYVTGQSLGSGMNYDYATIKYDSAGTQQWVARYDGPVSGNDIPSLNYHNGNPADGIAVDSDGNVYVTGYSLGSGFQEFATVKYRGSDGNQEWASRYSIGPGNLSNGALVLYESPPGDVFVYVIGSCMRGQTDYDYTTVKYNGSDGSQVAEAFYGLPALDYPFAIAIDQLSGTISVTGRSQGSGTNDDYATVKYDSDLNELWPARYDNPGGVISNDYAYAAATDSSGNVYVAGDSGEGILTDYATIKYNSAGTQQWVARYNGPGDDADYAVDIAVDPIGNIYVTGYSHGGPATRLDFATIKYDTNGTEQWVRRHHGGGPPPYNFNDYASAMAVDSAGNVYVTGMSISSPTSGWDYATVKYDTNGTEQWIVRYNGPANSNDYANDIAVDASGNVYVTGYSYGIGTGYDTATVKYDSFGTEQWVARYNGPANNIDNTNDIAVDASGNVYVTGYSYGIGTHRDYITIKYDTNGTQEWADTYNGPDNSIDVAYDIAVDSAGNAYVTGESVGIGTSYDMATIKYDTNGNRKWVHRYNGPGNYIDRGFAIAIDASGKAYVAGPSWEGDDVDYAILIYPADYTGGDPLYIGRYHNEGQDIAYDIALDPVGNVYVTGYSWGLSWDIATVKFHVPSPEDMIESLIILVESFNLKQGISNSLDVKLQNAWEALQDTKAGNNQSAINRLQAFINECEAQRGKALTSDQADQLIGLASQTIQALQQ